MSPGKRTIGFVPFEPQRFGDRWLMAELDTPDLTVGELLRELPALSTAPLTPEHLELKVCNVIHVIEAAGPDTPLFVPPGIAIGGHAETEPGPHLPPAVAVAVEKQPPLYAKPGHPETLSEREAVLLAHTPEINRAAAYLERGLSVLIRCEKLLVEHLAGEMAGRSGRPSQQIRAAGTDAPILPGLGSNSRADVLAALKDAVTRAAPGDVLVVPYLDLLAGGTDSALSSEARDLTEALYEQAECVLLGFIDPSLNVPEVLANRFAVRLAVDILPREVATADDSRVPVGQALVTREEAGLFKDFDAAGLYKHVAGMNAVRLRHAIRFAFHQHARQDASAEELTFADLLNEVRTFKARTSTSFEVPNVTFDAIGGYDEVKRELAQALAIIGGAADLPEALRHDLVPRGFIFHGPPGTGKTLFAKAIASTLGGTLLVVSGPEVTDMYVGESERKVRELFAEARRNAPAVVVFDEFDSIAAQRSGRDDGGSRAGNAIVAQLLTELDGFRPEVPVLIIGTTNRLDLIDEALLRPSRFRPIRIDLPDAAARVEIARWHAAHFGVAASPALLEAVGRATDGLNGDDIRSIFRDGRADELAGSRRPVDARRLGELVGALRRGRQQRDADRSTAATARRAAARGRQETNARVVLVPRTGDDMQDDASTDPPGAGRPAATGTDPAREVFPR
ncbi:transitional endoplasmic reticulum ATPase [Catenulispora sp. GP43]|uniref:ATP-binding protein n=1 Tax=Catenulispora sp. GP43 TaxID=3156263 RepID=UPI0035196001